MAQTKAGALKVAAQRVGLSALEYSQKCADGLKRCTECKSWQKTAKFGLDKSRFDGLTSRCSVCKGKRASTAKRNFGRLSSPGKKERKQKLAQGEEWCRGCRNWFEVGHNALNKGACRNTINCERKDWYQRSNALKNYQYMRKRKVGTLTKKQETELMEIFDGKCVYCQVAVASTFDHVVPVTKGGKTDFFNMVPACVSCNSSKYNRHVDVWLRQKKWKMSPLLLKHLELGGLKWQKQQ